MLCYRGGNFLIIYFLSVYTLYLPNATFICYLSTLFCQHFDYNFFLILQNVLCLWTPDCCLSTEQFVQVLIFCWKPFCLVSILDTHVLLSWKMNSLSRLGFHNLQKKKKPHWCSDFVLSFCAFRLRSRKFFSFFPLENWCLLCHIACSISFIHTFIHLV